MPKLNSDKYSQLTNKELLKLYRTVVARNTLQRYLDKLTTSGVADELVIENLILERLQLSLGIGRNIKPAE